MTSISEIKLMVRHHGNNC